MPSAKKREPIVPEKVKQAIGILLDQPNEDLRAAAKAVDLSTYRLREELKKAHVRRYLYHEKQALLDAVSAGNPVALKKVRDTSENGMAVVAAAKAIEQMRTETEEAAGGQLRIAPGVTIIIEAANGAPERVIGPPATRIIEAKPASAREFNPALDD